MRFLVLGGNGMLAHKLFQRLTENHEVMTTLRTGQERYTHLNLFNEKNTYFNVDVTNLDHIKRIISDYKPEVVFNGIGIAHGKRNDNSLQSIHINALLPHQLYQICQDNGAKLIQVSTDCVFSGLKGNYTEQDESDAKDLYGRTKYLGEVKSSGALTIRKSIIGTEIDHKKGLIEWFLAQKGTIKGFTNAIYTGIESTEFARIVEFISTQKKDLEGLYQVASKPISKYDLLVKLSDKLGRQDIEIAQDSSFVCDRSLDGGLFESETGYKAPSWDEMISNLATEILERNTLR